MSIKDCPFCSNKAEVKTVLVKGNRYTKVLCGGCKASGPQYLSKTKAIDSWNRRA